ncbi:MAG: hypothetical protein Fur0037_14220 [Planctomycetota bacterium]
MTGGRTWPGRCGPPLAIALGLLAPGSCGYTFGSGLRDAGIRTVFVRVVSSESYRQRLEAELSRALARELPATSGLSPASEAEADAVLEVALGGDRERTLVTGTRSDPVREGALEAWIGVRLIARADGRILVDREIPDRAEFRDPIGETLATARTELVEDLARKIALALETPF